MHSPIVATVLLEPIPRKATPPKAAALFAARAFRALFRFPTRTVRKPQAVVVFATIQASRPGEKTGRWPLSEKNPSRKTRPRAAAMSGRQRVAPRPKNPATPTLDPSQP